MLLLVPAVAVVAILFGGEKAADPEAAIGTSVALLVIAVASIGCVIGLKRRRVQLRGQVLQVVAGLFSHRVPVDIIDLERARVVDLDEHTALRPAIKTFGMALPGFWSESRLQRLLARHGRAQARADEVRNAWEAALFDPAAGGNPERLDRERRSAATVVSAMVCPPMVMTRALRLSSRFSQMLIALLSTQRNLIRKEEEGRE